MAMIYSDEVICKEFRHAKYKHKQIKFLAELNNVKKQVIIDILRQNGLVDEDGKPYKEPKPKKRNNTLIVQAISCTHPDCAYRVSSCSSGRYTFCGYCLLTGHMRGCEAANCDKYTTDDTIRREAIRESQRMM